MSANPRPQPPPVLVLPRCVRCRRPGAYTSRSLCERCRRPRSAGNIPTVLRGRLITCPTCDGSGAVPHLTTVPERKDS